MVSVLSHPDSLASDSSYSPRQGKETHHPSSPLPHSHRIYGHNKIVVTLCTAQFVGLICYADIVTETSFFQDNSCSHVRQGILSASAYRHAFFPQLYLTLFIKGNKKTLEDK